MIDDRIHRISAARLQERDGGHDQRKTTRSTGLRQGDQSRMDWLSAEQRFKVTDVLGDDDSIFGDAIFLDRMVELAATSDMQRMDGVVAETCEFDGESGRQTFVDE